MIPIEFKIINRKLDVIVSPYSQNQAGCHVTEQLHEHRTSLEQ